MKSADHFNAQFLIRKKIIGFHFFGLLLVDYSRVTKMSELQTNRYTGGPDFVFFLYPNG
jgi:hypothetical protein